jgi:uncharacterized protein
MTFGKIDDTRYLLRLERGEEIVSVITSFCKEQKIANAGITGIGSVENPTLAHYRVDTKKYTEKELTGVFEVTSLLGNVALFENEPLLHPHITLGDEQLRAFAGHLVKGKVSATLEVILTVFPSMFDKKYDDTIGLKLYKLE